ncbi:nickel/cobalt transporter [Pseudahrensia aquimaris]|uniref:Nickel/cobalt efflux system n=1 Tax=Pseudahrensia aquimaris TaxID=744461 RepID=A0ABW3FH51_9HYPH
MSLIGSRFFAVSLALLPAVLLVAFFSYGPGEALYRDLLVYVFEQQRNFHDAMKNSLSTMADGAGLSAGASLVIGSFLYGVFHAAGPGHGKVILSTYLLTQPENVRRSLGLAFASALMQGFVAIFLVYGLFWLFDMVPKQSREAVIWSERLSYGLVIAIGGWLLWRAVRGFLSLRKADAHHHHDHAHDHHGHHHHDHSHGHNHGAGEVCSTCGHSHVPTQEDVAQARDIKSWLGVIFSIGLRPCSGAVLVLVFARFVDLEIAGVFAVLAISLGTAITVGMVAFVAVRMRTFALGLSSGAGDGMAWAAHTFAALGGVFFLFMGYGLLAASFAPVSRGMGL